MGDVLKPATGLGCGGLKAKSLVEYGGIYKEPW